MKKENQTIYIIKCVALFIFGVLGALISRMCGGMKPKLPWGLDQWIYALPYGLINLSAGWWALLGYAGAFGGKRTGHGRGMSLKEPMKAGTDPEKLEYLILWLQRYMPNYWYKVLLTAITGVAVTILPGIILAVSFHLWWGVFLALSGLSKAPAYMIGWVIFPNASDDDPESSEFDEATEIGEALTGLFGYAALVIVFLYAFKGDLNVWFHG